MSAAVAAGRGEEELLTPPELSAGAAVWQLREQLTARGFGLLEGASARTRRIYFDTFDGRLGAAGLAMIHTRDAAESSAGRVAVVPLAGGEPIVALDAFPAPSRPILAVELAPGPLREALLPIVDVRALLALVELESEQVSYAVLDDDRKTVARLTREQAIVLADGQPDRELRPRLRLSEVRGYQGELARISACARELGFASPRHELIDEAVLAVGGSPGGTSAKVSVELLPTQRSDAAAAAILRRLAEVIEANLEGTISDLDAEFLHDLRVAVRRSRAVQRELRGVFPPDELAHFRAEFRWLQQVTGESRDLDVYVLDFDEMRELVPAGVRSDLDPVRVVLADQRAAARRAMARELRSPRMTRLRRDWDAFLEELVGMATDRRPEAERAIGELAGRRIVKVFKRMRKMGEAIDDASPSEAYHEIRKQGKELRYLLELFGTPLFPEDVVKPMIRALKQLQDVLGRHQDREVQRARMRELADAVAAQPGRAPALMAMGVLIDRLEQDEIAARAEFAERFAEFTAERLRRQIKLAFT